MAKFLRLTNGVLTNIEMIVEVYKVSEMQTVPGTEDEWGNSDQASTGKVHVMVNVAGNRTEAGFFDDEAAADAFISEKFEIA